MGLQERQDAAVRAVFAAVPQPDVPVGLGAEALVRGGRVLRRRRIARRFLRGVLVAAVVAALVWILLARPWVEPPSTTTPPVSGR